MASDEHFPQAGAALEGQPVQDAALGRKLKEQAMEASAKPNFTFFAALHGRTRSCVESKPAVYLAVLTYTFLQNRCTTHDSVLL